MQCSGLPLPGLGAPFHLRRHYIHPRPLALVSIYLKYKITPLDNSASMIYWWIMDVSIHFIKVTFFESIYSAQRRKIKKMPMSYKYQYSRNVNKNYK